MSSHEKRRVGHLLVHGPNLSLDGRQQGYPRRGESVAPAAVSRIYAIISSMETEAAYPAARIVSPKVHAYFARQRAELGAGNGRVATLPDTGVIQAIVDAAFWASLRREEGFIPRISLAFVSPEETKSAMLFERPLPLDPG